MIIRFMDYSILETHINSDEVNIIIKSPYDSSFINYDTSSKTNKIYFEWTHDSPINEKCINRDELEEVFSNNGWQSICYETNPSLNKDNYRIHKCNTSLWQHYFDSFSCITFEKK